MQVTITGRGLDVSEQLKAHTEEQLERALRLLEKVVDVQVVFTSEKYRTAAEVIVRTKGLSFRAEEETTDAAAALDAALEKVEKQVRRHRERQKERGRERGSVRAVREAVLLAETPLAAEPRVVRTSSLEVKPMSVQEAVLQLTVTKDNFLVFRNAMTERVNVMYARKDGNFGLIEPES